MSRGAQTFKQGDVTKALRAAEKAGFKVQRAEVRKDGSIVNQGQQRGVWPPGFFG